MSQNRIDLDGLKCNPPKDAALMGAIEILTNWFRAGFPELAMHHDDLVSQVIVESLADVQSTRSSARIFTEAKWMALAKVRELRRVTMVSIDAPGYPGEDNDQNNYLLFEEEESRWNEELEERRKLEDFEYAIQEILPQLIKADQEFLIAYLEYFRAHPSGKLREFGIAMGLSAANTSQKKKRVFARVREAMHGMR